MAFGLVGFLTSSSTTALGYIADRPQDWRLTIVSAATHETEWGDLCGTWQNDVFCRKTILICFLCRVESDLCWFFFVPCGYFFEELNCFFQWTEVIISVLLLGIWQMDPRIFKSSVKLGRWMYLCRWWRVFFGLLYERLWQLTSYEHIGRY